MATKSKLDTLITEAVGLTRELETLNADSHLTYKAFFAEALQIADCDEKRIAAIKKVVYEKHGTEHIQAYLRRYSKTLIGRHYPYPALDPSRTLRIYGSEELLGQMGQHQILAGELQALAIRVCHERYGDTAFGGVENRADHKKKTEDARTRLAAIYAEMRNVVCGTDLIYDDTYPAVLPSQREAGLCKVSFKRAPGISPSFGDWPTQIIADAMAPPFKKPKQERAKLRAEKGAA